MIETKSSSKIKEAEEHLKTLKKLISESSEIKEPEFLIVITRTDIAYTTEKGILIVSICCLKN